MPDRKYRNPTDPDDFDDWAGKILAREMANEPNMKHIAAHMTCPICHGTIHAHFTGLNMFWDCYRDREHVFYHTWSTSRLGAIPLVMQKELDSAMERFNHAYRNFPSSAMKFAKEITPDTAQDTPADFISSLKHKLNKKKRRNPTTPETRAFWDTHLEHNELRLARHDTDAAAFLSWIFEGVGDILREFRKKWPDGGYIHEKYNRLVNNIDSRDWTDPMSAAELAKIAIVKIKLDNLPVHNQLETYLKEIMGDILNRRRGALRSKLPMLREVIESELNKLLGKNTNPMNLPVRLTYAHRYDRAEHLHTIYALLPSTQHDLHDKYPNIDAPANTVGLIQYYLAKTNFRLPKPDNIHVMLITVAEEFKRRGIATTLVNKMKQRHPGLKLTIPFAVDEGIPFWRTQDVTIDSEQPNPLEDLPEDIKKEAFGDRPEVDRVQLKVKKKTKAWRGEDYKVTIQSPPISTVKPVKVKHWYGEDETIQLDTEIAETVPVPSGDIDVDPVVIKDARYASATDFQPLQRIAPEDRKGTHLWRGMSGEEWDGVLASGWIGSKGDYNLSEEQVGVTFFSEDPRQAAAYASPFAPWTYMATFKKPAVVVMVKRPADLRLITTSPPEVGVKGRIPLSAVEKVYELRVAAERAGDMDIKYDSYSNRHVEGSRSSQSHWLAYREVPINEWGTFTHRQNPRRGNHG